MDTTVSVLMKENDKEYERYRATLFVPRGFSFPGRWLGIAARSGHMNLKSNTIFSINEDDLSKNTGVAGYCYSIVETVKRLEIPYPDCDLNNSQQVSLNARYLYSTDREFRSLRLKNSQFHLATCIKVRGKIRGVLVLDSTDPAAAAVTIDEAQFNSILNHSVQMLSLILEDKGDAK